MQVLGSVYLLDSKGIGRKYKQKVQVIDVATADKWLLNDSVRGRILAK